MKTESVSIPTSFGRLAMEVAGPESDTAILFVHGWPDSHETWSHQMEYFSKKYRVGALDLPGVGDSDAPHERSGYHTSNVAPLYAAAAKTLGAKKVHLVAHDWGAIIGWVFVSNPEFASQIATYTAISCPHPALARENMLTKLKSLSPTKILEALRQAAKSYYIFLFQMPLLPDFVFNNFGRLIWPRALIQGGLSADDPMLDATNEDIARITVNPLNLYREMLQGKPIEVPGGINIPVQVIVPNDDLALTPELYSNTTDFVPQAQMHYVDANHWVQRSHPQLVNELIEKFIS